MAFFQHANGADSSKLLFLVDREPAADGNSLLQGWVFCLGEPVELELCYEGERLCTLLCTNPRHDVYRAHPGSPFSLLSGFELHLPLELLNDIGPGRLTLVARTSQKTQAIWQWGGSVFAADSLDTRKRLRQFFEHGVPGSTVGSPIKRPRTAQGTTAAHAVISCNGRFARTIAALKRLTIGAETTLRTVTLLLSEDADEAQLRTLIAQDDSLQRLPLGYVAAESAGGWRGLLERLGGERADLLLWVDATADLRFVDPAALIRDLGELPQIGLLQPACYGGGLSAPPGVHLGELRSRSRIHGADMPAICTSRSLAPVWAAGMESLRACANRLERDGGLNPAGLFPAGSVFHVDLRQPLLLSGALSAGSPDGYTAEERHHMQYLLSTQLEWLPSTPKGQTMMVVLPAEWGASPACAEVRRLLSWSESLQRAGVAVLFVADDDLPTVRYLEGHAVVSLKVAGEQARPSGGWIVAARWDAVRAAYTLRYLTGLPVVQIAQGSQTALYSCVEREKLELASWGAAAAPLTIALGEGGAKGSEGITLPFFIDQSCFFPHCSEDERQGVLFVCDHRSRLRGKVVAQVAAELRRQSPGLRVSVMGLEPGNIESISLIAELSGLHAAADASEAARLFSRHAVVVDCTAQARRSATGAEAAACGAAPLTGDLWGTGAGAVLTFEEPGETARALLALLNDRAAQERLRDEYRTEGGLASAQQSDAEAFLAQLAERYREVVETTSRTRAKRRKMSIVVPVYCALDATLQCLRSTLAYAPLDAQLIVVNDCSDYGTSTALRALAEQEPRIQLIEKEQNQGFVQACLTGFAAADPQRDLVLLNSDVVLTPGSLEGLQNAAYARWDVGLASSLSTNSPHLQLTLNVGDSLESAARKLHALGEPRHPTVITPEGQLLYIRRWALEQFGFFDSVFNRGFYEESDMCMRMFLHGVDMVVADTTLIFHRKSESFGLDTGLSLKRQNRPIFESRWLRYYKQVYPEFLRRDPLEWIRSRYAGLASPLEEPHGPVPVSNLRQLLGRLSTAPAAAAPQSDVLDGVEVVFIVPSVILGGGTLSVLQHVNELLLRGVEARVLTLTKPDPIRFPLLAPPIAVSEEQLMNLRWTNQRVVATFWLTSYFVKALTVRYPGLRGYYYIQDYEPWFYSRQESFPSMNEAYESYGLGLHGVAKTEYLCRIVKEKHGGEVTLIQPGIALNVFYPGRQDEYFGRPRLTAYYRPRTPRRGGALCIDILKAVKARVPEAQLNVFGEEAEFTEELLQVIEPLGKMPQSKVAELYRNSDLVLDMSFWHGFGRMGIEGMACGTVPVLTDSGGVHRYAVDGKNSFLVTHDNPEYTVDRIVTLLKDRSLRLQMREEALKTAARFGEEGATDDWLRVFELNPAAPSTQRQGSNGQSQSDEPRPQPVAQAL